MLKVLLEGLIGVGGKDSTKMLDTFILEKWKQLYLKVCDLNHPCQVCLSCMVIGTYPEGQGLHIFGRPLFCLPRADSGMLFFIFLLIKQWG